MRKSDRSQPGWLRAVNALAVATKSAAGVAKRMVFPGYGGGSSSSAGGNARGWWGRWMLPGSAGYNFEAEAGPLWLNSAVACCFGWVRRNFPEPRLTVEVRRGTEWVENPEHPVLDWLDDPNPGYSGDVLWAATAVSILADGNAYWLKVKAPGGRVNYWHLEYWLVFPCWPADGSKFVSHYEYRPDGKVVRLEVDEIIHFRTGLDPLDQRKGWAELKTCLREVCSDNEANTYVASILKNMGVVGVVISPESADDEIDGDEAKKLSKDWTSKTTGSERGKPIVNNVTLRITQTAMSPEQLTLDKIRQYPESRICAAIGTPAMVVGLAVGKEGRTFSNLTEANRHAYQNCLMPLQKSMVKDFQRQSKGELKGRRVERLVFRYDEVEALREDQSELAKRVVITCGGPVMSVNEGRSRLGLKPTGDPEHDKVRAVAAPGAAPTIGGNATESENRNK